MLYSYISISLCVILAIIGKLNEKKIFNPVISFYALWAFILILNSFHLFGLKETREEINLCILFGVHVKQHINTALDMAGPMFCVQFV